MALSGYGVLFGTVIHSRSPRDDDGHWLLMVQPNSTGHPPYRVGIRLSGPKGLIEGQVVDLSASKATQVKRFVASVLAANKTVTAFLSADDAGHADVSGRTQRSGIDYVRSGLIPDLSAFKAIVERAGDAVYDAFSDAIQRRGVRIAVYGTGYPFDQRKGLAAATGFIGVDNVHMNQGSRFKTGGTRHHVENGSNQDGALLVIDGQRVTGIFLKFALQSIDTDVNGAPIDSSVPEIEAARQQYKSILDQRSKDVQRALAEEQRRAATGVTTAAQATAGAGPAAKAAKPVSRPAAKSRATATVRATATATTRVTAAKTVTPTTTPTATSAPTPTPTTPLTTPPESATTPTTAPSAYVFADPNPADGSGPFVPEQDQNHRDAPMTLTYSKGETRGPVPDPRGNPIMPLDVVLPGISEQITDSIEFDTIGDSGAVSASASKGEQSVTKLMTDNANNGPGKPAFLFHVGDVVYFYGEQNYYYSQFYEPFQYYPAPIFAIPGNHDGIVYSDTMTSLDSFHNAFCAPTPARWEGSGGIVRSAMTQPGVYFTLEAPLISIVGLYSNCSESLPWLDDHQIAFFASEMQRLASANRAVMLAIHHCPRWYLASLDPVSKALDAACTAANRWPDVVMCGHSHLYQRFLRTLPGRQIPYVINGAGGYRIVPAQALGGHRIDDSRVITHEGYVHAKVTKSNMTLEFLSPTPGISDTINIDLAAHTVTFGP